jgi:2-polyprenyl-3-methyl-5-hydroxy-6-metoxy-1,4-benzoquinol methylase
MSESPRPWPQADLEAVPYCPICGSHERSVLYNGLTDRTFCVADGAWDLYRCVHCTSGYLDPRPTPESIGRAYAGYYTHDTEDHPIVRRKGRVRSLLHDLINGYQNHRYGLQRSPALPIGRWLLPLLPSLRTAADAECRHLPPLPTGGGRMLDVGCGNGGFLMLARQAGWQVEGLDFDVGAVETARSRGLEVHHGGIEVLGNRTACFDLITLSHVIEHVHEPQALLQALHSLLKDGGRLWLETPNIGSYCATEFKDDWRGLEPPRHLSVLSWSGLEKILDGAEFGERKYFWHGVSAASVYMSSQFIRSNRLSVFEPRPLTILNAILCDVIEMFFPKRREYLTVSVTKWK